jgi:Skp family chaperone for outer membrane proteins
MFVALIVLGVFCLQAAPASAQPTSLTALKLALDKSDSSKMPAGTTRVAVFNIGIVLNKYQRAANMKQELAEEIKQLKDEAKELTDDLRTWQAALQKNNLSPNKREQLEEKVINARRQLEDLDRQARSKLGKAQEASLTNLWKDIREAVKTYSTEHGIGLVIAYGDPAESGLVDVVPNINRKMQAIDHGGGTPFYVGPGTDISEALVELLNRTYRQRKTAATEDDPR